MLKKPFVIPALLLGLPLAQAVQAEQPEKTLNYQFYGQVNLGVLNADNKDGDRTWQLENLASRLGIKGEQALEHGLTLIFQYETGINPSEKNTPIFSQRNAFVGLKSDRYGQLIYGTFDTPLKLAQQKVDLFDNSSFDMGKFMAGEVRHSQSIQYSTPKLRGLNAAFNWLPAQKTELDDGFSAAINYDMKQAAFSLAMDKKVMGDGGVIVSKAAPLDNYRATASFKLGNSITLGALAQLSQGVDDDQSEEKNWLLSAKWQLEKTTLKAQLGQGLASKDNTGVSSNLKLSHAVVGVDYSLGKNTLAYFYSGLEQATDAAKNTSSSPRTGMGLKYKF